MKKIVERIFYFSYLAINLFLFLLLWIISPILKKRGKQNGILALPYTPKDWPGGYDRMDAWTNMFFTDGVNYHVDYAWKKVDFELFHSISITTFKRYLIFSKILVHRIRLLFSFKNYETIWIQRAFLPMFPYKDAYFEKLLARIHPHIIYDFYDADYASNYKLVMSTVAAAKKVTVATEYLRSKFISVNKETYLLRYAIDTKSFKVRANTNSDIIRIGWMGSPGNAINLMAIEEQLQTLESEFSNIQFSFLCRNFPSLNLKKLHKNSWSDAQFDYYEWLSTLDIGIVPFIKADERTKAKVSMKGLEFMAQGIPIAASPFIHSDQLENGISFLLTEQHFWYDNLKKLVLDKELRIRMGQQAEIIFDSFHTYKIVYKDFKEIVKLDI